MREVVLVANSGPLIAFISDKVIAAAKERAGE